MFGEGIEVTLYQHRDPSKLRARIKGDLLRGSRTDYQTAVANVESLKCRLQWCGLEGVSQDFDTEMLSNWDSESVGGRGDL